MLALLTASDDLPHRATLVKLSISPLMGTLPLCLFAYLIGQKVLHLPWNLTLRLITMSVKGGFAKHLCAELHFSSMSSAKLHDLLD